VNHRTITPGTPEWPGRLNELGGEVPPDQLFVAGMPLGAGPKTIAVVGTRRPPPVGIEATKHHTRGLAEAGLAIVSGLAVGIDAVAHRTALESGAYTIAVLGCGLDVDYPARNASLRRHIASQGTLVTEYEPNTRPRPENFPRRNRIIAGLAAGVLFVEGGVTSGGRITARLALDANRLVFAVPGSIRNPAAAGPNELIRTSQAALVTDVKHIFDEIAPDLVWDAKFDAGPASPVPALEGCEKRVLDYLDDVPVAVDRICAELEIPGGEVALTLSRLELRGMVARRPAGYEISSLGARARTATRFLSGPG
jgi:DNA processing protein